MRGMRSDHVPSLAIEDQDLTGFGGHGEGFAVRALEVGKGRRVEVSEGTNGWVTRTRIRREDRA